MANYSVTKNFGHFTQIWHIEADSDEEAWNNAENGKLQYQTMYRSLTDLESPGYVKNMDEKKEDEKPIPIDTYRKWLREAAAKGMKLTPYYYTIAYDVEMKI